MQTHTEFSLDLEFSFFTFFCEITSLDRESTRAMSGVAPIEKAPSSTIRKIKVRSQVNANHIIYALKRRGKKKNSLQHANCDGMISTWNDLKEITIGTCLNNAQTTFQYLYYILK